MTSQNSKYPRCVDGRVAAAFLENQAGKWIVTKRGVEAATENGPQFLGASLVFVRALQEVAGKSLDEAFELTIKASQQAGLGLQLHLDDAHGEHNISQLTQEQLIALMDKQHTGCGFAKYAWGDEGVKVIVKAKELGFRVQILVGNHEEGGAIINHQAGQTFDTAAGVASGEARFNTDVAEAKKVFVNLAILIDQPDFTQKATAWMIATYQDVVVALKGVTDKSEIQVIE